MKFSTRTTYGLRAMIRLAENHEKGSLALSTIAKEENLSLGYLERIFARLKKSKLVTSEMGMSGGYRLAEKPEKIGIYDIVKSLEGDLNPFHCVEDNGQVVCGHKCNCGATAVLVKVQSAIIKSLREMNLGDLVKG